MSGSPKELGAKQMLEQAVVYLYNSYREEGLPKDKASKLVTKELEQIYQKYADMNLLTKDSRSIVDPASRIDDIIKEIRSVNYEEWRTLSPLKQSMKFETLLKSLSLKLTRIKSLLK